MNKHHYKSMSSTWLKLLVCILGSSVYAVNLTPDNWDEVTTGKTVFVKFFASWCGHCKKMKPAWDELMKQYENNPYYVIGDVECSAGDTMQAFCKQYQVKGYPTVLYGDPNGTLEKYSGKRDLSSLQEFVQTNLKPVCNAVNTDACNQEQKALLEEYQKITVQDLQQKIKQMSGELKKAEQDYKITMEKMQEEFHQYQSEQSVALGLMKSVLQKKELAASGNGEL